MASSHSFFEFVRTQYEKLPIVPTAETCRGKTYIVTGELRARPTSPWSLYMIRADATMESQERIQV